MQAVIVCCYFCYKLYQKLISTLSLRYIIYPTGKLIPKLSNFEQLRNTKRAYKQRQAEFYNKRHRAPALPDLNPDDKV